MGSQHTLNGKRVIILGGTGSWGNELTMHLLTRYAVKEIIIYSRGEINQVRMRKKFAEYKDRIKYVIGDVRDAQQLEIAMKGVDIVFDLAALKHVPICEENPWETVQTNIIGTHNSINAAIKNGVERFLFISTDKAVDPFNLYGVTKSCAEKLVIAANNLTPKTDFLCVRSGNAMGTNGSVLPLFAEQIANANKITLTEPEMTRFFIPLSDAMHLITTAFEQGVGGEIFVLKMNSMTMRTLAEEMIRRFGDKKTSIETVGARPGEKMHEVLLSQHETPRAYAYPGHFVILPVIDIPKYRQHYVRYAKQTRVGLYQEYSSQNPDSLLDKQGTKRMLDEYYAEAKRKRP